MHMSTKSRLHSLSLRATSSTCEEAISCLKIICTLPHVKNKLSPKDHMHMPTKPRLASLYVQHLPHMKKQALTQRSYAHAYKTQTSLSLHATSSTREETSSCLKIICTPLHMKKQAKDHMHMSPKPRLASLRPTSSTHEDLPKDPMHTSTCEETSPHPKIICTCLQNPD